MAVAKSPSPTQEWELKTIATARGKTLAQWYSVLEVADHRQDIDETNDEISDGSNRAVIADARTNLPVLKVHLRLAEAAVRASR